MCSLWRRCRLALLLPALCLLFAVAGCDDDDRDLINKLRVNKDGPGEGTVRSSPRGITCGDDCSQYYADDTRVTLTATAAEGSVFSGWNYGDCTGTGPCVVTLDESKTVIASFDRAVAGAWQVKGNGFVLDIDAGGNTYDWYEVTEKSRLPAGGGRIVADEVFYRGQVAMTLPEVLQAAEKIDLPAAVAITAPTPDPEDNFEVFWHTFEQYYTFFDLMGATTWRDLYDRYRPHINQHTTADTLWQVFEDMIAVLNDGHTRLFDFESGRYAASRDLHGVPSSWMQRERDTYMAVISAYFDTFSAGDNVLGNDNVLYGTIDETIGYLNILAYDDYAETAALPFELSLPALLSAGRREVAPFAAVLDRVFSDFAGMEALVIDLRFNRGGFAELAKMLAGRLTQKPYLALSYRLRQRGYDDYYPAVEQLVEPAAAPFPDKPIIVLTSSNTASAGEWQVLMLRELPNVTVLGERTFGIFAEGIPRRLPNGWQFTLSTQRIYAVDGSMYEQVGIPPDIALAPDADLLNEGRDNMLEEALRRLRQ